MKLLDLFCGAGGAAMGYYRAGFDEIVGVDIEPQKHYPFRFVLADAMTFSLEGFDAIHASPPCQGYSRMRSLPWLKNKPYSMLIAQVRDRLVSSAVPWVIENVYGAKDHLRHPAMLCATMFGLPFYRHRLFEGDLPFGTPAHGKHALSGETAKRSKVHDGLPRVHSTITKWAAGALYAHGHAGSNTEIARRAMQIDWMNRDELSQAIPPAYTEFIGAELLRRASNGHHAEDVRKWRTVG